jgi:hypothetical protein
MPLPAVPGAPVGAWVEIVNAGPNAAAPAGWVLQGSSATVTLQNTRPLAPGAYAVVAVNGDPLENGGIGAYEIAPHLFLLPDDRLALVAPNGREADAVAWGAGGLPVFSGRSLERTAPDAAAPWAVAPGSRPPRPRPRPPCRSAR